MIYNHITCLGTRILRFSCETKLIKTVQKLSNNSRSEQGGGAVAPSPPPAWIGLRHCPCESKRIVENDFIPSKFERDA